MAPERQRQLSRLLFSTNFPVSRRDFPGHGIIPDPPPTLPYKRPKKQQDVPYTRVKHVEVMYDWKHPEAVPFSLFMKKNRIIHCKPTDKQERYEKFIDMDQEEVQKTRPRVVMVPSLSFDDIEDKNMRKLILDDVYEGTLEKDLRVTATAAFPKDSNRAPLVDTYSPAKPLALPKWQQSYVSPEWRMESCSWDSKQFRAFCRPTKEFWMNRRNDRSNH